MFAEKSKVSKYRKAMLAKIHIAKKELGLTEEEYRKLLKELTGKESCKYMNENELDLVLQAFYLLGWQPKQKLDFAGVNFDKKGMCMAIENLAEEVLGWGWKKRLKGYVKKKFGVDSIYWCNIYQLFKIFAFLRAIERQQQEEEIPF